MKNSTKKIILAIAVFGALFSSASTLKVSAEMGRQGYVCALVSTNVCFETPTQQVIGYKLPLK